MKRIYTLLIILSFVVLSSVQGAVIHVPDDQATIQAGIDAAQAGDTVLVADGTYTGAGNTAINFYGKAVTLMSLNGPDMSIIDCENNEVGIYFVSGETENSMVYELTIRQGYGSSVGGGIRINDASPTIINCIIEDCSAQGGGGLGIMNSGSTTIAGCTIRNNTATTGTYGGGGISIWGPTVHVYDSLITGNTAPNSYGGGIAALYGGNVTVVNSLIAGNSSQTGGGLYNNSGGITAYNSTIYNNTATISGGGFGVNVARSATVTDSIVWGNSPDQFNFSYALVTYSCVQGDYTGEGNIDQDPFFITGSLGDFYLDHELPSESPCIDTGSDLAESICYIIPDNPRQSFCMSDRTTRTDELPDSGQVDMGYHYFPDQTPTPTPTPICWNDGDVNLDGGLTSGDAQLCFYIVMGTYSPTFEEACAANCNGDESITAGDAQNIFSAVLGMDSCIDPL